MKLLKAFWPRSKKYLKSLFNFVRLNLLFLSAACVIIIILYIAWLSRGLPNPNRIIDRTVAQSTKIYESSGETILYEVHGDQKRTLMKFEDIPNYVKWATISAEDKTFYEHKGFNLLAMIKGAIVDPILHGTRARGGSTITQQLVKNAILTDERKISRKIREFILSYRIEQAFEKDQILQMYLNEIPYGSTAYGIQSAARTFFGKDAQNLTLGEAALLASLPKATTYYSPYGNNIDKLYVRQHYILDLMVENGYILPEEAEAAKNQKLEFKKARETIIAPHFVMYIKDALADMFGDQMVESGGLKVITTLDLTKQRIAEEVVKKGVEEHGKQYSFYNAALISIDPRTGQIISMVGSKDYFGNSEPEGCKSGRDCKFEPNDNVTLRLRQPGSSIKPMVYTEAFIRGFTPDTVLFDVNTKFKTDTKDYEPKNYDGTEHGAVTMRKALQGSLNIPAVKTLYLAGVDNVINFLQMLGYSSFEDRSRFGLSLVLGGGEVRPLEHVAAYGVLANEGVYHEPTGILRVEDSNGNVLYEYKDRERKVMDKNFANMISNVLSDNSARAYIFGEANHLTLSDRPVAAKTGTTNDYHDAWTAGYTPSLATVVWVGNNDNSTMKRGADGSVIAAPIWQAYMNQALAGSPVEAFNGYIPPETDKAVLNGNIAVENKVKIDKFTGKIATEYTPASAVEEKTFKEMHDILYYVNKEDPTGPTPTNPENDPQYRYWEGAVQDWITRQKANPDPAIASQFEFINSAPPTETDTVHLPENKPTIFITYPANNETIRSANLTAQVNVTAPRGVSRVEYYIDGVLVKTVSNYPYQLDTYISAMFVNGYHQLRAVAYDDVDNSNEATVNINVTATRAPIGASWLSPPSGTFSLSQFPLYGVLHLNDLVAVKKIDFYYRSNTSEEFTMFSSEISPSTDNIQVSIGNIVVPGNYEIKANLTLLTGVSVESESLFLNVN